jgi:biotin-(acetyl-CoA carboxylase) ligase
MKSMSDQMEMVNDSKYDELKSNYESKLYRLNQLANYEDEKGEFQGIIRGTTAIGKLIIERENRLVFYDLKEVVFR